VPHVPQHYEKWLASLTGLVVKSDLVTAAEIDSGKVATDRAEATPRVTAANAVVVAMTCPGPVGAA
jgi:hypothetical protein